MPLTLEIQSTAAWARALPRLPALAKRAVTAALPAALRAQKVEVSLVFATDAAIRKLNRDWRGKDKATNVLSFPLSPALHPEMHLGDIVLALGTIKHECANENKTLEQHVAHLLVHGMLHLLGYDHDDDADARRMMRKEIAILKTLGYANPYLNHEH